MIGLERFIKPEKRFFEIKRKFESLQALSAVTSCAQEIAGDFCSV
jgi:hypothetical protein